MYCVLVAMATITCSLCVCVLGNDWVALGIWEHSVCVCDTIVHRPIDNHRSAFTITIMQIVVTIVITSYIANMVIFYF